MTPMTAELTPPLQRLTTAEIEHSLRGFPASATSSAIALREDYRIEDLESCLFGILTFYLPAGSEAPPAQPSGNVLLREDLGLDSLALAEAMFKIEELFAMRVENTELSEIRTLADARRLLMAKLEPTCARSTGADA